MPSRLQQGFLLGPWRVEPLVGTLTGPENESYRLEPKVMDALVVLVEQAGDVVPRDKLAEAVWNGNPVSDERLRHVIADLRRALNDDRGNPKYIETIPKRGYRLIGQVRLLKDGGGTSGQPFHWSTKRKLPYVIVPALAFTLAFFVHNRYLVERVKEVTNESTSQQSDDVIAADKWEMSIAVLPFVNMTGNPDDEYFSDGLTEEILTLLARVPELKVIGRTSSFSFKGRNEDLRLIGETLGVNTILEGSVRKADDRVRVTAQLVDASDGSHIWSESYDRAMSDIFEVQDDVAAAVFDALQIHVGDAPTRGRPTENMAAYALYLKARAMFHSSELRQGEELLLRAIELEPEFAEAYELLAFNYYIQAGDWVEGQVGRKLSLDAATRALDIDPDLDLARALYQLGNATPDGQLREVYAFEQLAREQPGNSTVLRSLIWNLMIAGYLEEALQYAERFIELDPLSMAANRRLADALYAVGRTSEAIAALELMKQLGGQSADRILGEINLVAKRDELAVSQLEAWMDRYDSGNSDWISEFVARGRNPASGQAYLDRRIPEIVASMPEQDAHGWYLDLIGWYLYFGFVDRFFEKLLELDLENGVWANGKSVVKAATIYRRLGFTAHPRYLEVAETLGIMDLWEQRGPPDFCDKLSGQWACD